MRKIITNLFLALTFTFLSALTLNAQNITPLSKGNLNSASLHDLKNTFNERWADYDVKNGYYIENGKETKAPGWKVFKRFEWFWEQRVDLETGKFPNTNAAAEYEKVKFSLKKADAFNENWSNLGTSSSSGGYAGIGRINCIAFHPTDVNTFWVGSPSGGIWRTTDGGSNWTILNNNESVLGVSDIAIPYNFNGTTVNTIYIATGDRDGGSMWSLSGGQAADNASLGVYKSTDGGSTWSPTGLTSAETGSKIYRLLIHPSNTSILIASTANGIWKTSNGGTNWTQTNPNRITDMEFMPGDPATVYGTTTGYGDVYLAKSTNTGDSFGFTIPGGSNGAYRGELAVSANDPTMIYVLAALSSGGLANIYKSTDSGTSFSALLSPAPAGTDVVNDGKSMLGYYSDGSGWNTGQGSYDLCIAVNPANANEVYIGGINTWKSTNGGTSWSINNMWTSYSGYNKTGAPVVHADKHALAFQPVSNALFEGNDGGIYKTTNGGTTWSDLTDGMVISQLYRIGVSQTNSDLVITGLQDNGSKLFNASAWTDVKGGDGMECIIDYSNSSYMYATYVRGQISRSTNGGLSFPTDISANIPAGQPAGESPNGAWVTPYLIDPNNSSTLFAGYDQVWKTTDRGNTWTSASQPLSPGSAGDRLRSLAIAPSNSSILYAACRDSMWKTTDGGATDWSTITLPTLSNSITYIAVHPTAPNTLWITVGGYTSGQKIYESTDGGANWTNISTGLPNLPVMCVVHYKKATDRNVLFVGTDLGVYVKDGANNWAAYNTGLPNVVVTELEIYYNPGGTDKLRAGTYGRGLWETNIDAVLPVELTSFSVSTTSGDNVSLNWETETEVNNYGFEIERQLLGKTSKIVNDKWQNVGFMKGHGNSNSPKLYTYVDKNIEGGSKFAYRLKQVDINGQFEYSDVVEINIVPSQFVLEQNFPNPFNPTTKINYRIPYRSHVSLEVYNILGKEIINLVNEVRDPGLYSHQFDAGNLPSGIYYYTLSSENYSKTNKMMLVK